MKKIKRIAIVTLVFAILLLLFWKPMGINIISYFVYLDFKKEYDISSDFHTIRHIDDNAWLFGGTFGLSKLKRLENNPKISPDGQKLAKELSDYISSGKHLAYLKMQKEAYQGKRADLACPNWPVNVLMVYLYDHDIKRFKQNKNTAVR